MKIRFPFKLKTPARIHTTTQAPRNRVHADVDIAETRAAYRTRTKRGPGVQMRPPRYDLPSRHVVTRQPQATPVVTSSPTPSTWTDLLTRVAQILMPNVVTQCSLGVATSVAVFVASSTFSVPATLAWFVVTASGCKISGMILQEKGVNLWNWAAARTTEARKEAAALFERAKREAEHFRRQTARELRKVPRRVKRMFKRSLAAFLRGCSATKDYVQDTADSAIRATPGFALWAPRVMYRVCRPAIAAAISVPQKIWRALVVFARYVFSCGRNASQAIADMLARRI